MTRLPKKAHIYLPSGMADLYEAHENLEVGRVTSLKRHHERGRRFLEHHDVSRFRIKKIAKLPGVTVWKVNGAAIRNVMYVDLTMGGHGYRYLFVPVDEIWIDKSAAENGDLWPTIWHEFFERTLMRNGLHYVPAHRMACRLEIVLREGSTFVLPVGTFRQSTGFCGPASLKIYFNYLGRGFSERYLAKLARATIANGTDPIALMEAAEKLGFMAEHRGCPLTEKQIGHFCKATGVVGSGLEAMIKATKKLAAGVKPNKAWTVDSVKKSLRKGLPILANYQLSPNFGSGHYSLIIGFTKDTFIISDPQEDAGYREVPITEFMNLWYELEDGTFREGLTITP